MEVSLLNIETGKIENAVSQVINPEIPEDMENACKTLAEQLTGVSTKQKLQNIFYNTTNLFYSFILLFEH